MIPKSGCRFSEKIMLKRACRNAPRGLCQRRTGPFVLRQPSEPIFNVPMVVAATIAVMVFVHLLRAFVLSSEQDTELLLLFSFIPARYDATILAPVPGGLGAEIWSFVTYALIHGDATHLGLNAVWLLAFGTPVARRFGAIRYLAFFAVTSAAGAAAHLATHANAFVPMIGASAAISGFMAGAIRFAFQRGGPLRLLGNTEAEAYRVPALPLLSVLRDPRVLIFLGVWFGLNLLFGLGSIGLDGGEQAIAWQAHIGGFLAGLLAFALFDPVKAAPYGGTGPNATIH
jgi:membrane associated rhomboid family serine protease